MPDSTRGSIYISTADEIGETLVDKLGGSGYTPNEWDKALNLCGISDADIPTALENIENSADGTERGSFEITKANAIASVLNKKFKTTRGFKPKEWASAVDKLTALQVKNASGAIASFTDGADDVPIASASFSIVPYQNLNGYSKPWASGCGKNLFDYEAVQALNTNVTITRNNGDYTVENNNSYAVSAFYSVVFRLKPATYSLSLGEGISVPIRIYKNGSWFNNGINAGGTSCAFTVTEEDNYDFSCNVPANSSLTIKKCQLELGSSATSYEPYSNVCPITPYSQMTITHTKKNLVNGYTDYNVTNKIVEPVFLKAGNYTISFNRSVGVSAIYVRKGNIVSIVGNAYAYKYNTTFFSFNADVDGYYYFQLYRSGSSATWEDAPISNVMLEVGSSQTTFSPYSPPEVIGDNFGRSVYGGSRSSDGTLTETRGVLNLAVADMNNSENYPGWKSCGIKELIGSDKGNISNFLLNVGIGLGVNTNGSNDICFLPFSSYGLTQTEWKTKFPDMVIQIVVFLETPNEYALDPLPEINSYYGDNNIYTDIVGGESSVNYRADIDLSQ